MQKKILSSKVNSFWLYEIAWFHYRQGIRYIVIREMPWFFLCLEPGSGTYFFSRDTVPE